LIEIADEIRKGAGCHRIGKLVEHIVLGKKKRQMRMLSPPLKVKY
jgi:hypothetical protein